ncbi:MAG: methyltransferase domain-containing protein [Candidatus Eremiobacteraeota bacterium]|nr:methyltransferase domain-containing protein [Candidatus Eremiobacteraeota bacterium]
MRRCVACSTEISTSSWRCAACGFAPAEHPSHLSFVGNHADDGFEGDFFEYLAGVEPGFWWFEARNAIIVWALRRWFGALTSFLEVGCGTGFVVSRLAVEFPAVRFAASELFPEAMAFVASRVPRAELYQFDAREIPFRDEFDVIGAFDVIEHIDEDVRVLAEMRRALRPGGGLVLTVPQHGFLWGPSDDMAHHKRRYTRAVLRERLEQAGFRAVAFRSFVSLLMPAQILLRFAARHSANPDPRAEFRISPLMNRSLATVMAFEHAAIAAGMNSPFGGSLLAVAQRVG